MRLGAGLTQTPQTRPETSLGGTPVSPAASACGAIYKSMQADLRFRVDKYTYLIPGQGEATLPELSRILDSVPPPYPMTSWQLAYLSATLQRFLQQLYSLGILDRGFMTRPLAYPGILEDREKQNPIKAHGVYPVGGQPPVGVAPSGELRFPFMEIDATTPLSVMLQAYTPEWIRNP